MTKSKKNKRKGLLWLILPSLIVLVSFLIVSNFPYIFNIVENKSIFSILEIIGLFLMFVNVFFIFTIPFGIFQGIKFLNKEKEDDKFFIKN